MDVIPRDFDVDAEYRDGGGAETAEAGGECEVLGVAVEAEAETGAEAGHSRRRATQAEESGIIRYEVSIQRYDRHQRVSIWRTVNL